MHDNPSTMVFTSASSPDRAWFSVAAAESNTAVAWATAVSAAWRFEIEVLTAAWAWS